ncbi:MAG: histidine kinase [Treponema sp.]|nr:histidine kinase [Treponema sp.]
MILFSRLGRFYKRGSIRYQIMFYVILNSVITVAVILFMASLFGHIMGETGESFQSNADLDAYLLELEETKTAMESYIKYRTFGSVDKFFKIQEKAEATVQKFHANPSTIEFFQREYIIRKLSFSFFDLSQKAIAARRANNILSSEVYFAKSLDCYSHLRKKIIDLDMLFFTTNAKNYNYNKVRIKSIIQKLVIAMIGLVMIMVILPYISIRSITKPLAKISDVARRLSERDFDVPLFKNNDNDEIGNICRAFDAMIISIREYIDTIWERAMKENELREKEIELRALYTEARLKALQEQIKPHFLFNTLNSGAQLAMIEEAYKTCDYLEQVSDFLRYNLQHPGSEATIAEELGMLDNYIYIMKVRFDNKFTFIKDIDETVLGTKMPNMILQPLVENCMKHGLKDVSENGLIKITVKGKPECIEITISDNGCGFAPGVKERLFEEVAKGGEGIILDEAEEPDENTSEAHVSAGLVNVISRLRMYYKYDEVFSIDDNPECAARAEGGKGCVFFIRIKR